MDQLLSVRCESIRRFDSLGLLSLQAERAHRCARVHRIRAQRCGVSAVLAIDPLRCRTESHCTALHCTATVG